MVDDRVSITRPPDSNTCRPSGDHVACRFMLRIPSGTSTGLRRPSDPSMKTSCPSWIGPNHFPSGEKAASSSQTVEPYWSIVGNRLRCGIPVPA